MVVMLSSDEDIVNFPMEKSKFISLFQMVDFHLPSCRPGELSSVVSKEHFVPVSSPEAWLGTPFTNWGFFRVIIMSIEKRSSVIKKFTSRYCYILTCFLTFQVRRTRGTVYR